MSYNEEQGCNRYCGLRVDGEVCCQIRASLLSATEPDMIRSDGEPPSGETQKGPTPH